MANILSWKRVQEVYGGKKTPTCSTYRAKVPGGWLVSIWAGPRPSKKYEDTSRQTWAGGVAFVPDPMHRLWKVDEHPRQ
jgi:hypothetical protein